jgi:hypothetical protein
VLDCARLFQRSSEGTADQADAEDGELAQLQATQVEA